MNKSKVLTTYKITPYLDRSWSEHLLSCYDKPFIKTIFKHKDDIYATIESTVEKGDNEFQFNLRLIPIRYRWICKKIGDSLIEDPGWKYLYSYIDNTGYVRFLLLKV